MTKHIVLFIQQSFRFFSVPSFLYFFSTKKLSIFLFPLLPVVPIPSFVVPPLPPTPYPPPTPLISTSSPTPYPPPTPLISTSSPTPYPPPTPLISTSSPTPYPPPTPLISTSSPTPYPPPTPLISTSSPTPYPPPTPLISTSSPTPYPPPTPLISTSSPTPYPPPTPLISTSSPTPYPPPTPLISTSSPTPYPPPTPLISTSSPTLACMPVSYKNEIPLAQLSIYFYSTLTQAGIDPLLHYKNPCKKRRWNHTIMMKRNMNKTPSVSLFFLEFTNNITLTPPYNRDSVTTMTTLYQRLDGYWRDSTNNLATEVFSFSNRVQTGFTKYRRDTYTRGDGGLRHVYSETGYLNEKEMVVVSTDMKTEHLQCVKYVSPPPFPSFPRSAIP